MVLLYDTVFVIIWYGQYLSCYGVQPFLSASVFSVMYHVHLELARAINLWCVSLNFSREVSLYIWCVCMVLQTLRGTER